MGASADLYEERMRGPEPDEADQWVLEMALVMRARHERQQARTRRVLDALRLTEECDGEVLYVG